MNAATIDAVYNLVVGGAGSRLYLVEAVKLDVGPIADDQALVAIEHRQPERDAFDKIRSGLAGEAEPLRPLGIMLSEDAVKVEAVAMGLTRVKRELTEQEKILARMSLIARADGDYSPWRRDGPARKLGRRRERTRVGPRAVQAPPPARRSAKGGRAGESPVRHASWRWAPARRPTPRRRCDRLPPVKRRAVTRAATAPVRQRAA